MILAPPRPPTRGIFSRELPVLNEEGELIRGGMWASQKQWWDLPNFVRMLVSGYGGGKTIALCKRHIELALINAPIPTAIVSPTYSMARETVVVTLRELLEGQKLIQRAWGNRLEFTERKSSPFEFEITHQVRLLTGGMSKPRTGRVLIYSGENPNKLKGTNLSSAGIDEPFIQDQEVFEQMVFRSRHAKAKRREINLTGTPEQLNWGYDLAEGDLREKYDVGLVQASTAENKALGKGYVERLLTALDPKAARAYVYGQFVNLAKGQVFYGFDRLENVVELNRPLESELIAGMDFNVNPMAAAVSWVCFKGSTVKHIHTFDEIELPNSDTPDMCALLNERYFAKGLHEIYPDASGRSRSTSSPAGKSDYDYIREAGFEINVHHSGNPLRRDRFNAANAMLRPCAGEIRWTISPRCTKLIKYLMTYSHELMTRENQKAMSHLLDAATYPVAYLCPTDRDNLKQMRIRGA